MSDSLTVSSLTDSYLVSHFWSFSSYDHLPGADNPDGSAE